MAVFLRLEPSRHVCRLRYVFLILTPFLLFSMLVLPACRNWVGYFIPARYFNPPHSLQTDTAALTLRHSAFLTYFVEDFDRRAQDMVPASRKHRSHPQPDAVPRA